MYIIEDNCIGYLLEYIYFVNKIIENFLYREVLRL